MIGELQYDKHGVSFLASKLKLFGYIPAQPVVFFALKQYKKRER